MKPPPCFEETETRRQIDALCKQNDIDMMLLKDLCEVVQQHSGSGRREGITSEITDCIERFLQRQPN
jgi:hypothetical protein